MYQKSWVFRLVKHHLFFWLAHFPVISVSLLPGKCVTFHCKTWLKIYQKKLLKTRKHWYNILEILEKQNLKSFVNTPSSVFRIRHGYWIGNKTADLMLMLLTSKTFLKIHVLPECAKKPILDDTYIIYLNYLLWFTVKYRGIPNKIANICCFWSRRHNIVSCDSLHFPFLALHNKNLSGDHCVTDNFSTQADVHFLSAEHNYFVLANKKLTLDGLTSLMDCCFKTRAMNVVDYLGFIRQMSIGGVVLCRLLLCASKWLARRILNTIS